MSPFDRRLLTRIALRMEREAKAAYEAAGKTESAKETRNNIVGDVLDLKDYIARQDAHAEMTDGLATSDAFVMVPRQPGDAVFDAISDVAIRNRGADPVNYGALIWRAALEAVRPGETAPPPPPPG